MKYSLGEQTSGDKESIWLASSRPLKFKPLRKNITVDVVVVGAGITGLTTAYMLSCLGQQVAVVEDGYIGSGETGRTTAHLTYALDDRYYFLRKVHGKENTRLAAESHKIAIEMIEAIIQEEKIKCDFERVDGYLFIPPGESKQELLRELKALRDIGNTEVEMTTMPIKTYNFGDCLYFPNQAQLHAIKYLNGLAKTIIKQGGKIFTQTHAAEIAKEGVKSSAGYEIKANNIVIATNTPINDKVSIHTKQGPYRTYVIAATIPKGSVPKALYWDTGRDRKKLPVTPYHYVRLMEYNKKYDLVIVGGEDHKTGQQDDIARRYADLEEWSKERFPIQKIMYRWSGQVMEPVDGLAFIGKNPGDENIYIATGDSGNGMTHGTIAGMLISDLIIGYENPWKKIYDPSRKNVWTAKEYVQENINVAKQYAEWIEEIEPPTHLKNDEGIILQIGLKKIAYYKDKESKLHMHSAICPHLGCIVHWNTGEKTFDCPCHGSRFTGMGKVINGPSNKDLQSVEVNSMSPMKGVKSRKRTRQYEHIKQHALRAGRPTRVAKRIAAATVNKTRRLKHETKDK